MIRRRRRDPTILHVPVLPDESWWVVDESRRLRISGIPPFGSAPWAVLHLEWPALDSHVRHQRCDGMIRSPQSARSDGRSLPLLIASTLCFSWSALLLLLTVLVAIPMFSGHGFAIAAALFPAVVLMIAGTYGLTGYLIYRRRRSGAWLGVAVAVLGALLQFAIHLDIMSTSLTPGWLAVDAVLLVCLLTNWGRLDEAAPGARRRPGRRNRSSTRGPSPRQRRAWADRSPHP